MGRKPCCNKQKVRKGQWSAEEDAVLKSYMETNGTATNWIALPEKIGLNRCGKSCRLRWLNYLRPNIKHGGFTEKEDNIIANLYFAMGSRWSIIAEKLQGRTDNDIKNYWNTKLQKKFFGKPKKSARRLSSYGGFLDAHKCYNNNDSINLPRFSDPNYTTFTIIDSHLMSYSWTPPTNVNGSPPSNMISFSTTSVHCNIKQQQQQDGLTNLHRHSIINDDSFSSSIVKEVETALFSNDSPSDEINAQDLLYCIHNENNMVHNDTINVATNNTSNRESLGSWDTFDDYVDWYDISFPLDTFVNFE